jgi:hypothetical protein
LLSFGEGFGWFHTHPVSLSATSLSLIKWEDEEGERHSFKLLELSGGMLA